MSKNVEKIGVIAGGCLMTIAIIIGLSFIMAIPVWLLWNWLMPMIFGLTKLTLVQAWGISLLSNCLIKSFSYKE